MKLSKRIDRSYLPKQGQSENLLHRSEKRCKFGPTGGMGVSAEVQYTQCAV